MNRRSTLPALVAVLALVASGCASGGDTASAGVDAEDVRSRVSLASTGFGAVYMDLNNAGDVDDELVSASVDEAVAGSVELHETVPLDDSDEGSEMDMGSEMSGMSGMEMREVEGIAVPAGETVTLTPGGLHVMLIDLATDLEEGDEFDVDLEFEQAGSVTVTSTVSANP